MGDRVRKSGWVIALILAGGGLVLALDPPRLPSPSPKPKKSTPVSASATPGPYKVKESPFRTQVTLQGVLEAEQMHELAFRPHTTAMPLLMSGITVREAVAHGVKVKKGDVLVQFDTKKLDRALPDARSEHALARITLERAEKELPILEASLPLDLADAERAKKEANEDQKRFVAVNRPLDEESARQMVKDATYRLQAAQEELKQLQSMYRDKDLTEQTEEYILKRQRQEVEDATFYLKAALIQSEGTLKLRLPRRALYLEESTVRAAQALDKTKNGTPLTLAQAKLTLQKSRDDFRRGGEDLRQLKQDLAAMTVRAPIDGVVYYGQYMAGQWSSASSMAAKLRPNGIVMPNEVFMTVVTPRPMYVRAMVDEKDVSALRADQAAKVTPAGFPRIKLTGRVVSISAVPESSGKFLARLAVDLGPSAAALMPGMACEAKVNTYRNAHALTVPASAVFTDDDTDDHYVYLSPGGKRQVVKVGESDGKKTEILEGLKAGAEILSKKPE